MSSMKMAVGRVSRASIQSAQSSAGMSRSGFRSGGSPDGALKYGGDAGAL